MADKLKMMSGDVIQENIDFIAERFPHAVTEIKTERGLERKIDFAVLKQELSASLIEDGRERYQMTWPGKKNAILLANSRIKGTLRPDRERSLDFDKTGNLYIEGDNLDVLKLLRETYLNKIKMIYIDPPYNTGNDFIYKDDFAQSSEDYLRQSGQFDEEGNRLVKNVDTNGRFHTDWLNMMYPRLKIAKDLLTDDGVIFISIDDNEQANLKNCCDEIFGNQNFLAQLIWERAYAPINLKKHFSECHDYILCYAKHKEACVSNGLPRSDAANDRYSNPDNDPRGLWKSSDLSVGPRIESKVYEIVTPGGRKVLPPSGYCWRLDKKTFAKYKADNRIWFGTDGNNVPSIKRFLSEVKQGMTPMTIWKYADVGHSQDAAQKLKKLFDGKAYFDYPKSVELIKRCLQLYTDKKAVVLDFFSGSATTAHAVMQLNAEDGGDRKFIMVQLPEETVKESEAYKAGYKTICDIGEERIRRAGQKIKDENPLLTQDLDVGFRVLKFASSNMNDVYYDPTNLTPDLLQYTIDNVKIDRTPLDLLFQVMLELGIELSARIEERQIADRKCFIINGNDLVACFDNDIDEAVIRALAVLHPVYAVFKDSSFRDDETNINCEQIFRSLSVNTTIKVI